MKKVYCLYRVSTLGQVEKDDIPMQKQSCREFIERHPDWQFYKEIAEKGVSGFKVSAAKRDAILEIQQEAMQGKFDVLLVFMFDRLGRRDDETPFVVEWFVKHGVEVWSVNEGEQKFEQHVDKLMNYIRFWQAAGESEKTSIRTKTRLGQIIQEGRFRGGGVPYGYRIERQGRMNKKNHEVYELLIDEYESDIVRRIFELYTKNGLGTQSLATRLTELGIVNRKGQNFHPASVLNMLKNPTYLGILRSNESRSEPFEHLRIIDDYTWHRAQELIAQRSHSYEEKRRMPRKIKGDCLLSGNIFCGHCGARMTLTSAGKAYEKTDGTVIPHKYLRYVCYNRTRHKHLCDGQTGYASKTIDDCVERVLLEAFSRLKSIPNDGIIEKQYVDRMKDTEVRLNRLKKQLSAKTSELADLKGEVVKVIRGTSKWNMEILNELITNTNTEICAMQEETEALQDEHEDSERLYADIQNQYRSYLDWADTFSASELSVKKMIASQMIDEVKVRKGNHIEIDFNISLEQFLGDADQMETLQNTRNTNNAICP